MVFKTYKKLVIIYTSFFIIDKCTYKQKTINVFIEAISRGDDKNRAPTKIYKK